MTVQHAPSSCSRRYGAKRDTEARACGMWNAFQWFQLTRLFALFSLLQTTKTLSSDRLTVIYLFYSISVHILW
ncbi:hypothetical protein [Nostoc sp. C117]|uniref:hypothetical protein n=1 Tax=Nostoc sp. C117 TaxID=3349875 RepID=UPI00370DBDC2